MCVCVCTHIGEKSTQPGVECRSGNLCGSQHNVMYA